MFHARISAALNIGLLDLRQVCSDVESAYWSGRVGLNAAEGFIRQLIGWREYVRGVYWLKMPDYASGNLFGNSRPLPEFYWTGETKMNCMSQAIGQSLKHAYAHHIQRLMVTGNFALLAGIVPEQICEWYLAIYMDAFDWVELPNTLGMVMHADGGYLGSSRIAPAASTSSACLTIAAAVRTRSLKAPLRMPARSMRSTGIS